MQQHSVGNFLLKDAIKDYSSKKKKKKIQINPPVAQKGEEVAYLLQSEVFVSKIEFPGVIQKSFPP